ncbi:ParB/RepB/Spo0J family partition protein [uncultured Thiodictyon sp.]|uniref:ParB/RepB/Spo0J family partition protein n=1 Tax=uncultured Thiodictyon sp. TaxID=1846217 RepID=UPI0025EC7F28|nr:ParB/RepB/Spo0J family partition protein [uncultured Thiodictyon sp.]
MSIKGIANLADLMEDLPTGAQEVALSLIDPDPHQPRTSFDQSRLDALAASVLAQGVIEPLVVSPHPETAGRYLLVAGERRWRAAGLAGLETVAVVVREFTAEQRLAVQLVENIDREELTILEESAAVGRLIDFGRKPKEVADMLGKTPAWVSLRRKIEAHRGHLELFVVHERTRDAETLAMLVDLGKIDEDAFSEMHRQERITRAAVREALEIAKRRKLAPVTPLPSDLPEPADPSPQPQPKDEAPSAPEAIPEPSPKASVTPPAQAGDSPPSRPSKSKAAHEGQDNSADTDLTNQYEEVRLAVQASLGMTVQVVLSEKGEGGQLRIDFSDLEDLAALRKALS